MTPKCFQTLENGQRCSASAIVGSRFCRHHNLQHSPKPAQQESREPEPLNLPLIVDNPSALTALNKVLQAISHRRIKHSEGQTLLSGIRFASRLIAEIAAARQNPTASAGHFQPIATVAPIRNNDKLPLALAAAADQRKPSPFSTGRRSSLAQPEVDPVTASMIKDLIAQSQQLPRTENARARS